VVVPEFSSSNRRGCGCSHWSRGRARKGQVGRMDFPCTEQDQRDGRDIGIGWWHGGRVQDTGVDCFGLPTLDAHPQIHVGVNRQVCPCSFGY